MHRVDNPTPSSKAVRVSGGHRIIGGGKSVDISADWSDVELEKYRAAGLVIEPIKPKTVRRQKGQKNEHSARK